MEDGYGVIVTKEQLHEDKFLPFNQCCTLYLKPEPTTLDDRFFRQAKDRDLNASTYLACWNRDVSDQVKKIVMKYHPHSENIRFTQIPASNSGNILCNTFVRHMATRRGADTPTHRRAHHMASIYSLIDSSLFKNDCFNRKIYICTV